MASLTSLFSNMDIATLITLIFITVIIYVSLMGFSPFISRKWGVFSLIFLWKEVKKIKKELEEAIQKLPDKDHRNLFAQNYKDKIDPFLSRKGSLFTHLWIEFKEQLIYPTKEDPVFQNSFRPEKFFTREQLLKKQNINFKLVESLPGILLGLGVLGTFTGLSMSLIRALPKLKGTEPNIEEAVNLLISGAGVAFFTSVAGLLCSLIFNIFSDKKISRLDSLLNEFNLRLEKCLKFVTAESLLAEQIKTIKQQERYLSNMDEQLAMKIGDRIDQSVGNLGDKIQNAISNSNQSISEKFLEDISNKMAQGMGDFSTKQRENLEKTLSSLQDNIPPLIARLEQSQKQSEQTTKQLITQLAETNLKSQNQINESLAHSIQQMKSDFGDITQNLKEGMDSTLSDSSKELSTLISSLNHINKDVILNMSSINKEILEKTEESRTLDKEHFDKMAKNLKDFMDRVDQTVSEINTVTTDNIKSAMDQFNQVVQQQKSIVDENQNYISALDELSKKLSSASRLISDMTQKLPRFVEEINRSNELLSEKWESYEKRFESIDEKTAHLFENIKEGLTALSTKSAEYVENLYQQSAKVSGQFVEAVEELKEAIEDLSNKE